MLGRRVLASQTCPIFNGYTMRGDEKFKVG